MNNNTTVNNTYVLARRFDPEVFVNRSLLSWSLQVGCKITASLLHYCFLTLFMWMFCTAMVAFCLHAEVGRGLVKRWWSVLILAYCEWRRMQWVPHCPPTHPHTHTPHTQSKRIPKFFACYVAMAKCAICNKSNGGSAIRI